MKDVTNSDLIELYKIVDEYLKALTKEKENYQEGE